MEKVPVWASKTPIVPDVCCCCLAPKEMEHQQQVYVAYNQFFGTAVPWCKACRSRSNTTMVLLVAGMFLFGLLSLFVDKVVGRAMGFTTDGAQGLAALGFIVGLIAGAIVALKVAKVMNRPGHVSRCSAVGSMQGDAMPQGGEPGGHLTFHNAAFARHWRELNP